MATSVTVSQGKEAWCPKCVPGWCSVGCTFKWLTIIAGCLCILGGVIGFIEVEFGRRWILFFYQCLFGLILIGNEIPLAYIQKHFPSLCTFEGKGFFLIFVSTYMFGNANKGYDDSGREALDVLSDICGIVLVVKGVFCLLLWLGKYTCCPTCVQVEAESIAGAHVVTRP